MPVRARAVQSSTDIEAVVRAVAPKPVNVRRRRRTSRRSRELAELGVRRISVGGALARTALTGFLAAAREIAGAGHVQRARPR